MKHKFFPQQRNPLGQSQYSSADCPVFSADPLSAVRGIIWALVFVSPFWMLGVLIFLYFMN